MTDDIRKTMSLSDKLAGICDKLAVLAEELRAVCIAEHYQPQLAPLPDAVPAKRMIDANVVLTAIEAEPEYPDTPEDAEAKERVLRMLRGADDDLLLYALRLVVRQTKAGIMGRISEVIDHITEEASNGKA